MRALERVNAMITLLCPPGRLPKLGLRIYHGPIRYTKVLKQKTYFAHIVPEDIESHAAFKRHVDVTRAGRSEMLYWGGESVNFP